MAAIDGISSVSNATAATYQVKQAPEVNSVEAVNASEAEGAGSSIASQVVTVREKDSNGGENSAGQESKNEPTNEQIKKAVEDLNKKMKNTSCEFGIHDGTNRVTIKIVDKDSKKTIKEFPAEETLDMIAKAWELAGLMVDKRL